MINYTGKMFISVYVWRWKKGFQTKLCHFWRRSELVCNFNYFMQSPKLWPCSSSDLKIETIFKQCTYFLVVNLPAWEFEHQYSWRYWSLQYTKWICVLLYLTFKILHSTSHLVATHTFTFRNEFFAVLPFQPWIC